MPQGGCLSRGSSRDQTGERVRPVSRPDPQPRRILIVTQATVDGVATTRREIR